MTTALHCQLLCEVSGRCAPSCNGIGDVKRQLSTNATKIDHVASLPRRTIDIFSSVQLVLDEDVSKIRQVVQVFHCCALTGSRLLLLAGRLRCEKRDSSPCNNVIASFATADRVHRV